MKKEMVCSHNASPPKLSMEQTWTWLHSNLSKVMEHSDSVMEQKGNGLRSQCEPPKTQHGANMDVVSNHTTSGTDLGLECKHTWSAITQRAEPT